MQDRSSSDLVLNPPSSSRFELALFVRKRLQQFSVSDVSRKVLNDYGGGEEGDSRLVEEISGVNRLWFLERSDLIETQGVNFPDRPKKEQIEPAIELDGRKFGNSNLNYCSFI